MEMGPGETRHDRILGKYALDTHGFSRETQRHEGFLTVAVRRILKKVETAFMKIRSSRGELTPQNSMFEGGVYD